MHGALAKNALTAAAQQARLAGGGVAHHALEDSACVALAKEASALRFTELEPEVGPVRQQGWHARPSRENAPLTWQLVQVAAGVLASHGHASMVPNEATYQRYQRGEGVSAHRDSAYYVGLVVVVNVLGEGTFEVVADRSGREVLARWSLTPGSIVVLDANRHPGVMHLVRASSAVRLSLTLRHDRRSQAPVSQVPAPAPPCTP